ncbi:hypothetical protein K7432_012965 [Basidiobolus ranarum]|uniref:Uncharacterized protein n=1 Tax=Basidiobolus ranarum TaxID=34480 RepID=A0ABR2VS22_9FUNG
METIPIRHPARELALSQRPESLMEKKCIGLLPPTVSEMEISRPYIVESMSTQPKMTCELKSTKENVRALAISSFNDFCKPRYAVNTPFGTAHQNNLARESLSSLSLSDLSEFNEEFETSSSRSISPIQANILWEMEALSKYDWKDDSIVFHEEEEENCQEVSSNNNFRYDVRYNSYRSSIYDLYGDQENRRLSGIERESQNESQVDECRTSSIDSCYTTLPMLLEEIKKLSMAI